MTKIRILCLIILITLITISCERKPTLCEISMRQAKEEIKRGNKVLILSSLSAEEIALLYEHDSINIPFLYPYDSLCFNKIMISKNKIDLLKIRGRYVVKDSIGIRYFNFPMITESCDFYPYYKPGDNYFYNEIEEFIKLNKLGKIDSFLTYNMIISFIIDTNGILSHPIVHKKLKKEIDQKIIYKLNHLSSNWVAGKDKKTCKKIPYKVIYDLYWYQPIGSKFDLRPHLNFVQ